MLGSRDCRAAGGLMNPLTRVAGLATDRMLGLGPEAVPYVVRRDVAVPI